MTRLAYLYLLIIGITFISCDPQLDDKITLPPTPDNVSFTINEVGNNTYQFTNTSIETFIHQWDLGNGKTAEGDFAEVQYGTAGVYTVTLIAFNAGGQARASKDIIVDEDVQLDCENVERLVQLSNCDQKIWKLDDAEGALFVGPNPDESWWTSAAEEPSLRPCAWDDEWIFKANGEMIYDTKGQLWAEDYMGFDFECIDDAELPATIATWGSGNHSYEYNPETDQLTVLGLGAFIGLPKATNGAEVTSPVSSITYNIIDIYTDGDKQLMLLEVNMGEGIWRYRLKSDI